MLFALGLAVSSTHYADEVVFNNGDRLTGKVVNAGGGKLKVQTANVGEVTFDLANVRSVTTDEPVELNLTDGSTLKQRLEPAEDPGVLRTSGGGVVGPQTVPFSAVSTINPPPPPPVKWTGNVRAAAAFSRGNSFTDSFSLGADAVRRGENDRRTLGAGYRYGRERARDSRVRNTTQDDWFLLGKYDYYLTKKLYLYALGRFEQDRVANLLARVSPNVGVGYQWVERPDFNVRTETGFGWQYENYENDGDESHFTGRAAYHIDRKFKRVTLFHDLEFLPSLEAIDDFNVNASAGTRYALTDKLFTEFRVVWQYDASPAPEAGKNDIDYLLSVGWTF
jgi:putative salt-induced outer membrane protein